MYHDSMPGRSALNPFFAIRSKRQAALGDEPDAARWNRILDHPEVVVEPDTKVGIVPSDDRVLDRVLQEPEIIPHLLEIERLVVYL
jgi:hypothetical protein